MEIYDICFVFLEPLAISSNTPNKDISNNTVNDNITIVCQVETCVPEVTILLYKNDAINQTFVVTNNTMDSVIASFTLNVQLDTAGIYGCRGVAPEGSTPLVYFNITGINEYSCVYTCVLFINDMYSTTR